MLVSQFVPMYVCFCLCVCVRESETLQPLLTLDAREAAGNMQQLIKYLRLHLIQDFMWSFFLWPRAIGQRLPVQGGNHLLSSPNLL